MAAQRGRIALYWGPRREPLEVCAQRAYDSLRALKALGYDRYFFRGRSRRQALERELDVTPEAVLRTLSRGMHHTDIPRRPMPQLGWRMGLWSGGADDECYSIDLHCGAYAERIGNNVLMALPAAGPFTIGAAPERALRAYETLVGIWNPDQAIVCEGECHWDEQRRLVPERPPLAQHPAPCEPKR